MAPALKIYDTASEAVNDLARRGYTMDLTVCADSNTLKNPEQSCELSPDEFRIDEVHRFEGMTDPGDEMVVFAVSSLDGKIKGSVVNAFGPYSSGKASDLIEHLKTHF